MPFFLLIRNWFVWLYIGSYDKIHNVNANRLAFRYWCITLCLKKSIGKYHEGWWWSRGKILDFLPRSRRLRGRKSNIFPRDYHQPRVVFSNTFFQTKGNNNHFLWVMLYILSLRHTWTLQCKKDKVILYNLIVLNH